MGCPELHSQILLRFFTLQNALARFNVGMAVSEKLAREALQRIQQLEAENQELRARLGEDVLGDAIGKSLRNPASGQPRNRIVTGAVREAIFTEKPVSKAAAADRKAQLRKELQRAKGLRPKDV